jgi:hypothetical protein
MSVSRCTKLSADDVAGICKLIRRMANCMIDCVEKDIPFVQNFLYNKEKLSHTLLILESGDADVELESYIEKGSDIVMVYPPESFGDNNI